MYAFGAQWAVLQTCPGSERLRSAGKVVGGFLGLEVRAGDLLKGQVLPGEVLRGLNGGAVCYRCLIHFDSLSNPLIQVR